MRAMSLGFTLIEVKILPKASLHNNFINLLPNHPRPLKQVLKHSLNNLAV